jgi:hypothetical protein
MTREQSLKSGASRLAASIPDQRPDRRLPVQGERRQIASVARFPRAKRVALRQMRVQSGRHPIRNRRVANSLLVGWQ